MKNILALAFLFSSVITHAQITITSDEFPELGDENRVAIKDFSPDSFPMLLFDLSKDTFAVDLSNIVPDSIVYQNLVDPSTVPGGGDVKGADMAFYSSLGVTFAKQEGDSLMVVGVTPVLFDLPSIVGFEFDEPATYYTTPLSFDSVMVDSASTKQDLGIFSLVVKLTMSYEANGYGKIKTEEGWFDVIRLQRRFEFKIKTIPVWGEPFEERGLYVNWEFLTVDEKWPLLKAATILDDVAGGRQDTFVRFETLITKTVNDHVQASESVEILSFNNYIKVSGHENDLVLSIIDFQGRKISSSALSKKEHQISLESLKSGFYIIHCEDTKTGELSTKKIYKN